MKRFPGYDGETQEYSADVHRKHILGQDVANYMQLLEGIDADSVSKSHSVFL